MSLAEAALASGIGAGRGRSAMRNGQRAGGGSMGQPTAECLFGELSFAGAADSQGVDQREKIVERRIVAGREGHAAVERRDGQSLPGAVGIRPDGDKGVVDRDLSRQRRGSPGGRNPAREFAEAGRKRVGHTETEKFLQGLSARLARAGIEQPGRDQARTGGMHLRSAHAQLARQHGKGPIRAGDAQLEGNEDVLGLGHSLFAIREWRISKQGLR